MSEEEDRSYEHMFSDILEEMRKNAWVKTGAAMFGEAQMVYFNILKEHMGEEEAFNMLAHTTECLLRAISAGAGPVAEAFLKASTVQRVVMVAPEEPQ